MDSPSARWSPLPGCTRPGGPSASRRTALLPAAAVLVLLVLLACGGGDEGGTPPPSGPSDPALAAEEVASGLARPLQLTTPAGDDRLFVVEQRGTVRVIEDGDVADDLYLDLRDRVRSGGEQGLLSLAFHPDFAENGRLFVNFTDLQGDTRVEEFVVDPEADAVAATEGRLVLGVEQPFANHNGGQLEFGPDGHLLVALGDGGSGGDPAGNGQDPATLLGSLLRIDVDGEDPYGIPPDNPFVGGPGRDEVWAYGLRNPWRFAFDRVRGLLYVADVGQASWEEVNVIPADSGGVNFGWNVMEGRHCFRAESCDRSGLRLPAVEYGSEEGCAVVGGEVYRGSEIPELEGHYFYADYCTLRLRSFVFEDGEARQRSAWDVGELGRPLGFGRDGRGRVYLLTEGGGVYRLARSGGS